MQFHRNSLIVGAVLGALVLFSGSIFAPGPSATQAEDDLRLAIQKTQAMTVTYQLDSSGFHELDVTLNSGQMVPGALGKVRRARIVLQNGMWPAENDVKTTADRLVGEMMQLEQALRDENVTAAAPRATQVHDIEHTFSDKLYAWLGSQATAVAPAQPAMSSSDDHGSDEGQDGHSH
jgi:hypothetical protein